ncbi:hypothetical protein C3Y87_01495 [Carbonactinospora thermoautotrophica]|uniref:hypothetical protein n=1 Tax=Carbonactinospora thermoautotrophica TaxID=1469144 RepID=UPI00082A6E44|nr:hypothetical protein [Carbonactinospora thermoautotrophica]MCX9190105.1 hypothetical protein [Carbonactinospora thermoautotrophica]
MGKKVILVGANPAVLLQHGGDPSAFASLWRVEWSERGSGDALILCHAHRVRVLGPDPEFGLWLAETFVRHFPEASGFEWPDPILEKAEPEIWLDPGRGLTASVSDITLELADILDRRLFHTDRLELGGVEYGLTHVYAPCARAHLTVGRATVPGVPICHSDEAGPVSSAFLAVAETWCR